MCDAEHGPEYANLALKRLCHADFQKASNDSSRGEDEGPASMSRFLH